MNAADLDVKQVLQSPVDCLGQMLLAGRLNRYWISAVSSPAGFSDFVEIELCK